MRKPLKKTVSAFLAAAAAVSALAVNSSALKLCIGGKCYEITLQSGNCINLTVPCFRWYSSAAKPETGTASPGAVIQTGGETSSEGEAAEVLAIVNSERENAGLPLLTMSAQLSELAAIRAKEIVKLFSHTRPDGTSCFSVFREKGVTYRYAGENIAYGQTSAAAVMKAWMGSSGHRANILGKNFRKIGIACHIVNGRKYWVQIFSD